MRTALTAAQSLTNLQEAANRLVNGSQIGYERAKRLLLLQWVTGARIFDVLECEHWEETETGIYYQASKNQREIYLSDENHPQGNIKTILTNAQEVASELKYEDVARYTKKYKHLKLQVGTKTELRTHLFRYLFVREQLEKGKDETQISQLIGDTIIHTSTYAHATIYKIT